MRIPLIKTLLSLAGTVGTMGGLLAMKTSAHGLAPQPLQAAKVVHDRTAGATMTVTGPAIPVTHGIVQVRITLTDGHITDVSATSLPHDNDDSWTRSVTAAMVLDREVIAKQSAHIDGVSGATYTSKAYKTSLQAAIDAGYGH